MTTYGNNIQQSEETVSLPEDYFNVRNPLRNFRSYSARWLITAHADSYSATQPPTVDDYTSRVGDDYSGGGIIVVNEAADTMVTVNEITWMSSSVGINDVTTSLMMGSLSLSEPFGVNLLAQIREWGGRIGTDIIGKAVFAARVTFVGHKDDNTDEMLTGYPGGDRALYFTISNFNAAFTVEGVTYDLVMMPLINGNLMDASRSPIASLVSSRENRDQAAAAVIREEATNNASSIAAIFMEGKPVPPHLARHLVPGRPIAPGTESKIRSTVLNLKNKTAWRDITLEFQNDEGKVTSRTFPINSSTTPESFTQAVGSHIASMASTTDFAETDGSGLSDASDERGRAERTRNRVSQKMTTVGEAMNRFTETLNTAAKEWFDHQIQSNAQGQDVPSPIKYEYELVVSEDLAACRMTNISPKTQHATSGDTTEQQIDGPTNINFDHQATIQQAIHSILSHSVEVADRVAQSEQREGMPKRKETSEIVRIRTMRIVQGPDAPVKIKFLISLADDAVPADPNNLSTKSAGQVELEFDYLYGNRYTDLIEFDMSLDWGAASYNGLFTANSVGDSQPKPGDASRTVSSISAHPDVAELKQPHVQISSGSPYAEKTAHSVKTQAFLSSISDAARMRQSDLTIRTVGDPYLCWDSMGSTGLYVEGVEPNGYYFKDHHNHPVRAKVNVHYPVFQNNGASSDSAAGFYVMPFWYQGPFHLYGITNTFSQSAGFTQELRLSWDINTPSGTAQ